MIQYEAICECGASFYYSAAMKKVSCDTCGKEYFVINEYDQNLINEGNSKPLSEFHIHPCEDCDDW